MVIYIATLRSQRSHAATAEVLTDNIQLGYTVHAAHLDVFTLKNSTSAATILALIQESNQIRVETVGGQPESTIDGEDLHDFLVAAHGFSPYSSVLTTTDNDPHFYNLLYPFSPFPTDPSEPFGLAPLRGTQLSISWLADTALFFDTYTYDLTVEGVDSTTKPNPKGYVRFTRDAQTGVVGQAINTRVQGNRLLGVHNFMTTGIDDLAAAAAVDVTTIRTQEVIVSGATRLGPMRPSRTGSSQRLPLITATPLIYLDNASHFQDFGYQNDSGDLGVPIPPTSEVTEIRTTAGAANAYRTYPVTLI